MAEKKCSSCGNEMSGSARARYCSAACRQRAHRANRNADRNVSVGQSVTVTPDGGHSEDASRVLSALAGELAANGAKLGQTLEWSAAEEVVLEQLATLLDRKAELQGLWRAGAEPDFMIKLSAEMRLLEGAIARLLLQVRTDVPPGEGLRSEKARRAARARWDRGRGA